MQGGTFTIPGYSDETSGSRESVFERDCPTRRLLDRIGDKWSVLILLVLGQQDTRFNGLKRQIGGISQKMLSQTLRSLERDGLVTREVELTTPPSVTYGITPLGRELLAAMRFMIEWAETRMANVVTAQELYDRRTESDVAASRGPAGGA